MNTESEKESEDDTHQELSVSVDERNDTAVLESLSRANSTAGLHSVHHESVSESPDKESLRRRVR